MAEPVLKRGKFYQASHGVFVANRKSTSSVTITLQML